MRIALLIEYRGTDYSGWQRQDGRRTVQGVIEDALSVATGESITLHASGRTDAGVHAVGQVAHFDTSSTIPWDKYPVILNNLLPPSVSVRASQVVGGDFHARKSAVGKTYGYRVIVSPVPRATEWDTAYCTRFGLDVAAMREAATTLLGTHDFASFYSQGSTAATTVRTLTRAEISIVRGEPNAEGKITDGEIVFYFSADGFLYNMVRVLAAQLLLIGQGKKQAVEMAYLMRQKSRAVAKEAAPPQGLTLICVDYDPPLF